MSTNGISRHTLSLELVRPQFGRSVTVRAKIVCEPGINSLCRANHCAYRLEMEMMQCRYTGPFATREHFPLMLGCGFIKLKRAADSVLEWEWLTPPMPIELGAGSGAVNRYLHSDTGKAAARAVGMRARSSRPAAS